MWRSLQEAFLRRVDQRFQSAELEAAFRVYVQDDLYEVMRTALYPTIAVGIFFISGACWVEGSPTSQRPFRWEWSDARTGVFATWVFSILSCCTLVVCLELRSRYDAFKNVDWEWASLAFCLVISLCIFAGSFSLQPALHGLDQSDVWSVRPGGGWIVVDFVTASICLTAPVRSHLLWVFPASVVVCFTLSLVLVDVMLEQFVRSNIMYLTILSVLCFYSFLGAWRREAYMRSKYLVEKSLAQLQFEKEATSSLVHMTCDAAIWLSTDGRTILESDRWLDHTMQRTMQGESFFDCLDSDDDKANIEAVLRSNAAQIEQVPVTLLHARLVSPSGDELRTDLLMVNRRQTLPAQDVAEGFLVGIKCNAMELQELPEASIPKFSIDVDSTGTQRLLAKPNERESECTIQLAVNMEVLAFSSSSKLTGTTVLDLRPGIRLYCLSGGLDEPVVSSVEVKEASASSQQSVASLHICGTSPTEDSIDLSESSGVLCRLQHDLQRLFPLPCQASAGHAVAHVDISTAFAGLAYCQYAVESLRACAPEKSNTIQITLGAPCLAVFIRRGLQSCPAVEDTRHAGSGDERPFFGVSTSATPLARAPSAPSVFSTSMASSGTRHLVQL
eukprot:TRINITY_DN45407_c0_g2_i2.p1 TRINITY_DN45407_c0_g2~~TRINITY_DN45407_c0_g2_i2.p1  ORF type:complete len:616 (+),score=22.61 TRINITY_DN45407_c0_g2_i2:98-1945(+)